MERAYILFHIASAVVLFFAAVKTQGKPGTKIKRVCSTAVAYNNVFTFLSDDPFVSFTLDECIDLIGAWFIGRFFCILREQFLLHSQGFPDWFRQCCVGHFFFDNDSKNVAVRVTLHNITAKRKYFHFVRKNMQKNVAAKKQVDHSGKEGCPVSESFYDSGDFFLDT